MAVARSSVLALGTPHHPVREMPRRRRSSGASAAYLRGRVEGGVESLGDGRAGLLDEEVAQQRQVLDEVPVRVDDGMVDPGADLRGIHNGSLARRQATAGAPASVHVTGELRRTSPRGASPR